MSKGDIYEVYKAAPHAKIVVSHMKAINHALKGSWSIFKGRVSNGAAFLLQNIEDYQMYYAVLLQCILRVIFERNRLLKILPDYVRKS